MNQKYFLIIILFFLTVFSTGIYAQPQISGVINAYSKVDSVFPSKDTLVVVDITQFSEGDTVMIYQAKGGEAYVKEDNNWELLGLVGAGSTSINSAGKYEIIIIEDTISLENQVI